MPNLLLIYLLGAKLECDYLVMHNLNMVKRRRYIYSFDAVTGENSIATNATVNTNQHVISVSKVPQSKPSDALSPTQSRSEFETPSKSAKTPNTYSPAQAKKQMDLSAFFVRASEKPKPIVAEDIPVWNEEHQPLAPFELGLRSKNMG